MQCASPEGLLRYVAYISTALAALGSGIVVVFDCTRGPSKKNRTRMLILAAAAFGATWYHLLGFLYDDYSASASYKRSEGVLHYLCSAAKPGATDLFTEAYKQVTAPEGWVWSSSLLHGAIGTVLLLHLESARTGALSLMQLFSLLLLDFTVANSAALCLFLAATDAAAGGPFAKRKARAPGAGAAPLGFGGPVQLFTAGAGYISSAAAAIALGQSPPSSAHFKLALGVLHAGLLVPALLVRPQPVASKLQLWGTCTVLGAVGLLSAVHTYALAMMRGHRWCISTSESWYSLPAYDDAVECAKASLRAGWASHCQASISYDYVFTLLAALYFVLRREKRSAAGLSAAGLAALLAMLYMGVGAVLPFYMLRELVLHHTARAKPAVVKNA